MRNANDTPKLPQEPKLFNLLVAGCLLLTGIAVVGLALRQNSDNSTTSSEVRNTKTVSASNSADSGSTTVTSGMSGFSVSLPDGWGPVIKPKDSDMLLITGETQPTIKAGAKTIVSTVSGYGGDSPGLFMVVLEDTAKAAAPRGEVSDFIISKEDTAIKGKKYEYYYEKDEVVGIGDLRLRNDRDYDYILPVSGGRQLHVMYSVYGVDPRNQVEAVDGIVRSLHLTIKH